MDAERFRLYGEVAVITGGVNYFERLSSFDRGYLWSQSVDQGIYEVFYL